MLKQAMSDLETLNQQAFETLKRLKAKRPKVHCITNWAAMTLTANMLLAIGATPSLSFALEEIEDFVSSADALLINLGTLDDARLKAIPLAIKAAKAKGIPIVLDPVFVNRSAFRLNHARELLKINPTLVRMNREEYTALKPLSGCYAITGQVDEISHNGMTNHIPYGHAMMSFVTAMGCAGTAVMAAALAVESDALSATTSALIWLGKAGERASIGCEGVGSFQVRMLDEVFRLKFHTN